MGSDGQPWRTRLPESKLLAIIPVMVKIEKPLPPTVRGRSGLTFRA